MQVNLQYAQSHMTELAEAADRGEKVEIAREGKATLHLVPQPSTSSERLPRGALFNSAKGKLRVADDWDSEGTNEEVANSFDEGPLFPPEA